MTSFAPSHGEDLSKLKRILARLEPVEREALTRFYVLEHGHRPYYSRAWNKR